MKKQPAVEKRSTSISRNTPETLRYFFHPDHIGSTSWVTDSAKNGIQYCEYLPYGEPFLDQRLTSFNSRYTFSAKEKDIETGYSYFGARYYTSDLSIWLSVDPLSDKYPSMSPYNYCANNPVILVDPDGEDIWELDEVGKLTNIGTDKEKDVVIATKTKEKSEFAYGTIKEMNQATGQEEIDGEKKNFNYEYLDIKGDEAGKQFFEFAAKNTDVEWAHIQTGTDDNRIGTAGRESQDPSGGDMVKNFINLGITVRNDVHSHDDKSYIDPNPSLGDFIYAGWAQDKYGTKAPPTSVYSKQNGKWDYTPYNRYGIQK